MARYGTRRWLRAAAALCCAASLALVGGCADVLRIHPTLIRTMNPDEPLTCDGTSPDCVSVGAVRWSVPLDQYGAAYSIFSRELPDGDVEDHLWPADADDPTQALGSWDLSQTIGDIDSDGLFHFEDGVVWLEIDPESGDVSSSGTVGDGGSWRRVGVTAWQYPVDESVVASEIYERPWTWGMHGSTIAIARVQLDDGSRMLVVLGCLALGGPPAGPMSSGVPMYTGQCLDPVLVAIEDAPAASTS